MTALTLRCNRRAASAAFRPTERYAFRVSTSGAAPPRAAVSGSSTVRTKSVSAVSSRASTRKTSMSAGVVFVGTDGDPTVVLTDLTRDVDAAQSIKVTLTFARAGSTTVTAIVGSPPHVLLRGPAFRF